MSKWNSGTEAISEVAEIKMFSCVFDSDYDKHHVVPDV